MYLHQQPMMIWLAGHIIKAVASPGLLFILGAFLLSPSLQPAVINPTDIPWYTTPFFAIILILGMFFYNKNQRVKTHPIIILFAGLATLPILFHFSLEFIYQQLFYIAFIIAASGLAITGYNLDKKEITYLFYVFIIAAYIWAISALIVWFGFIDNGTLLMLGDWALTTARSVKINGPFVNGNVFAIMIFCAWLICLWFWLKKRHSPINFWLFSMTFFWIVAFLSLAKAAYLVHLLPLTFALFYCFRKKLYLKVCLLCITAGLTFFLASELNNTLNNETSLHVPDQFTSQLETLERTETRPLLYASIYEIWLSQPYIGVGYGKIRGHYLTAQAKALEKYQFEIPGFDLTSYGHNTVLHLMAEAGLIGILLSLIITLLLISILARSWKDIDSNAWPIAMMLVMLWLQGLINITLTRPFPILLFSLLLGIILNHLSFKKKESTSFSQYYLIVPLIISATLLLTLAYSNTTNWRNYEKWITVRNDPVAKKILVPPLLNNPSTMPYMVAETARAIILSGSETVGASLLPHIKKALRIQETRNLYQALFFSQVYNNNFKAACETGKFIQSQHWQDEGNDLFYDHACQDSLTPISTTPHL